jgi:glycosyltransferase involved in cell wall biosynthesis
VKICLVYPYAAWLAGQSCGGAEKQVGLLAQHLARRGHQVVFVALHYPPTYPPPPAVFDGVVVLPAWDESRGVRIVRSVTYRIPSLSRLLKELSADLYYVRGAQSVTRWVTAAAHEVGSPALLGLAHDRNLEPSSGQAVLPADGFGGALAGRLAWHLLLRPALFSADCLVVQSDEQAAKCSSMGLRHQLIPSIVAGPPQGLQQAQRKYDALWAGNIQTLSRRTKGLDVLRALALALPDRRFAVAGTLAPSVTAAEREGLACLPNVDVLGRLEYAQLQGAISASRLVLNTSSSEGFSNVMLEGWSLGRPSLTLAVNPNGLLGAGCWPARHPAGPQRDLGACAQGDPELLRRLLVEALDDVEGREAAGRRSVAYVQEVHSADRVCQRYEDLAASLR